MATDIGKRITFWEFVKNDVDTILIPEIQRDYVQGRETPRINDIRSNFLDDIYSSLVNGTSLDLNFVYGKSDNKNYIPIDGQQRLTTLFLLHVFAFSKEKKTNLLNIIKKKLTYNTRTSTKEFIAKLCDKLYKFDFASDIKFYITDSEWFFNEWSLDPSVKSMIVMLSDIYEKFNDFNNLSEALINNCPISFMLLDIKDIGQENDLYIKMNARGRPLTNFECFKSELFDYIDKNNLISDISSEFKRKIDDDWLNLLWEDFKLEKDSDKTFMELIHYLLFDNYICANNLKTFETDDVLKKIDTNETQGIFSFNNYKPLITDDSLRIIGKVLDLLCAIRGTYYFDIIKEDTLDSFIKVSDRVNRHYINRSCLMAISTYAKEINVFDLNSFEEWYRLSRNLIVSSSNIDKPEKFCDAIKTIYSKYNNAISVEHPYRDMIQNEAAVPFFFAKDKNCEVLKAKIISKDSGWIQEIRRAEENKYLHSSISFLFWLQNINYNNVDAANPTPNVFHDNYDIFSFFVNSNGLLASDDLFRRALLTYGDYSFEAGSSRTFSFEGGDRYFDFLRLLNEENSFDIFKLCFEDYSYEWLNSDTPLKDFLDSRIQNFNDTSNEFIYWLVKEPKILDYSRQNRFVKTEDGLYIILSKNYVSAEYREFYTFLLMSQLEDEGHSVEYKSGRDYLSDENARCYISSIDNISTHIEIIKDGNDFVLCDDNKTLLNPRVVVNTYQELRAYIANNYNI